MSISNKEGDDPGATAEGWVFSSEGREIEGVRGRARGRTWPGKYGLPRPDVGLAFPSVEKATRSGFQVDLPVILRPNERLSLETRIGGKWESFFSRGDTAGAQLPWYAYAAARLRAHFTGSRRDNAARYEGLERGYICWIDHPEDWRRVKGRFNIAGWCFCKKGEQLEDIRAWVGSESYTGRYRLSRPDVVAFLGNRPGVLESGFEITVNLPFGVASTFRLEARHPDGSWREVFRKRLGVSLLGQNEPRSGYSLTGVGYRDWIKRYETLTFRDRREIRRHIGAFMQWPRFIILVALAEPNTKRLRWALRSIRRQIYPHWELCLSPSKENSQAVRRVLSRYARMDKRIKLGEVRKSPAFAGDDYIIFLNEQDELAPTALYFVAHAINENPNLQLIYSDEDEVNNTGLRDRPKLKPDWNATLFLERNYLGNLCAFRSGLIESLDYSDAKGETYPFDLLLRSIERINQREICHLPRVLYHRRTPALGSLSEAATDSVQQHLARRGIASEVSFDEETDCRRVRYLNVTERPSVSIVIPTRDMVHLLRPCLESILEKTSYVPFEIVVIDNGSKEAEALQYLAEVSRDPRVRILRRDEEFNYSRLNNLGVEQSEADFVVLMNNDVMAIHADWLEELVSQGGQPGVGAVAPRLLYPDGRIQQAGVILGAGAHGVAEVAHRRLARNDPGYEKRAALAQELSAIGAACMLVRRSIYLEVGGFDEEHLRIAFNDIDFCLKVRERGYRIIYTPHTELYHLEHASRGWENTASKHERFTEEIQYMKEKWKGLLLSDPAYNPNLSLGQELFTLAFPPRVPWPWRSTHEKAKL